MTTLPAAAADRTDSYPEILDHEDVVVHRGRRSGLYTFVAVHSTVRGPSLGGCRMWGYSDARQALTRCTASVERDDVQVGGRGPAARRRQGRDHDRPRSRAARRAAHRRAARLRRHRGVAGRPLHHRRGCRHLEPRHARDSRAHPARGRAPAAHGRLGRSQPVHRARRGVGDPGLLRARVRLELAARSHRRRGRARPRRLTRRQAVRPGRRQARAGRHRPEQAPAGR